MSAIDRCKEQVRARADDAEGREVVALSRRIHAHPEVAFAEHQAATWCRELLERHGFEVAGVPGVETAFVATRRGAQSGPTVGFLAEYDALPEIGHGCGHNLVAGAAVGAGVFLAAEMPALPGTVRVFGCPAEELGAGKLRMLDAGAFAGLDVALTFHPWHATALMRACTGLRLFDLIFRGRAAHAAEEPWRGASALDAVLLTWTNLNALRQFIGDGARIHGIVTDGGQAPNVIPERAACTVGVRAADLRALERIAQRLLRCAQAAAMAADVELEVRELQRLAPVRHNAMLGAMVAANLHALGESVGEWRAMASTDFGDVSQAVPAVLFAVGAWPPDVAFHTREAAACAGGDQAMRAMLVAAQTMARTALDLLTDGTVVAAVRAEHRSEARPHAGA
ncbi:MAG: M20 family metallopeptidase [Armatimonadota bacterium]|nr:M20 family metallopeptidase [Armatimonadota bacterium]MDR7485780.1 M20 family metallopeptidase [Armatimonadota bacterium]MDR7532075.1 M20 family metallopeptidase [Armatimonadota bacterium]MDR7537529.1 M20 family metallopeptidase [Armatimonadota bacterium]